MNQRQFSIEELLPHRQRMRLVDEIIAVDETKAVTRATVSDHWPFSDGKDVNALVFVELVAQTAGISNSWDGIKRHGDKFIRKGWLVGIKQACFGIATVPLNTRITTSCENYFEFENYREIHGIVEVDATVVAEVRLQLVQSDET